MGSRELSEVIGAFRALVEVQARQGEEQAFFERSKAMGQGGPLQATGQGLGGGAVGEDVISDAGMEWFDG